MAMVYSFSDSNANHLLLNNDDLLLLTMSLGDDEGAAKEEEEAPARVQRREEVSLSEIGSAAEAMRLGREDEGRNDRKNGKKGKEDVQEDEEVEEVVEEVKQPEAVIEEEEVDVETATAGMSDTQKRLFKIRMRMNQGRKTNKKEVENEYKRFSDPKYEAKQRYNEKMDELKAERSKANRGREIGEGGVEDRDVSAQGGGGVAGDDPVMLITAEAAERIQAKALQKEKNMATFGLQVDPGPRFLILSSCFISSSFLSSSLLLTPLFTWGMYC